MALGSQKSFSGGELAPALYGRTDIAKYRTGLRTLRNFFILKSGGAANRSGMEFIAEVKDSTKVVRLVEFIFNDDQTYIMEFGHNYIRFYRNGAQIEVSSVTAWSNSTSYVIGDLASRLGVNYYCIQAHTNQQPPNATYWYPLTDDIYEIPTTYDSTDLMELQYVQSADVVIIVHPDYVPRSLSRSGHTTWTIANTSFGSAVAIPTSVTQSGGASPPGAAATSWYIAAVSASGEESHLGAIIASTDTPSGGSPIDLEWDTASGIAEYRIYREFSSSLSTGLIGTVSGGFFQDIGQVAELGTSPQVVQNFTSSNKRPGAVAISQQRLLLGGSHDAPETIWCSRIGSLFNFLQQYPVRDDDPTEFTLSSNRVNRIQHIIELRQLLALTSAAEWAINGDSAGIVRPSAINAKQQSFSGASRLRPLALTGNYLYVQSRGSIIRDLSFDFQSDSYSGNDLTVFSSHLFDGHTIVDWAYQKTPHSVVWAVRDDGVLLALTYLREHEMLAWSRHDTDGLVENVNVVPEGTEDAVYVVVKRTIDGSDVRYIERMGSRQIDEDAIEDAIFMDSALSYDGRNADANHTMTLSGGTDWDHTETLTLTSSEAYFVSGDVGNAIHLTGSDGTEIRFTIGAFTNDTVVTGKAQKLVPTTMRSVAISVWAKAVDELSGLDHLEGENVAVFADGFVVANPNNSAYSLKTVASGAITLSRPYAVIHVGLPYLSDIETLDIDTSEGSSISDRKKLMTKLNVYVDKSRGFWAGAAEPAAATPLDGLTETKLRTNESYDEPIRLHTENVQLNIRGNWSKGGRVFIRNIDPIPLSILSIEPAGFVPIGGKP